MEQKEINVERIENPSILGMVGSPRQQFNRIRENPKIIVALIVVTLIAVVSELFTLGGMDAVLEEEFIGLTDEEIVIVTAITQITTVLLASFMPALIILIGATVYFIVAKIANREVSFKQMFSLFTYITFITGLGGLLNGIITYFVAGSNPEVPFTSLNILFHADGGLGVLFSAVELFSIWGIILTAIGLQVVAKFSKPLAWGVVLGFNILIIAAGIMLALAGQSLGV